MKRKRLNRLTVNDVTTIHSDLNKIMFNRNLVYVRPKATDVDYIKLVSKALTCLAIEHTITFVNVEVDEETLEVNSDVAILLFSCPLMAGLDMIADDEPVRSIRQVKGFNKNLSYINRVRLN